MLEISNSTDAVKSIIVETTRNYRSLSKFSFSFEIVPHTLGFMVWTDTLIPETGA